MAERQRTQNSRCSEHGQVIAGRKTKTVDRKNGWGKMGRKEIEFIFT
jgi:hypothetical protein